MSETYTHTKSDPILTVDGVTRHFGGMTAVDVDHLEVQRGTITALIGPNGAGKTTFFNLLTGFDKPSPGATTRFNGDTLQKTSATHIANKGMVRTFQLTKALSRLTVMQNMLLGARDQPGENFFVGLVPDCGGSASGRSPRRPRTCSPASSSSRSRTTTPDRSRAASGSSSRWRGRSCPTRR